MKTFATRALNLAPSMTVAIDTMAKEMIRSGMDVVALGAGEPDAETPDFIKAAAIHSIEAGFTRYTAPDGILALKEAVCRKLAKENNLSYQPNQIVISSGAKHCVCNSLMALVEPGDEVIIPAPYWVTYPELVRFLGGIPVLLHADISQGFRISPAQLEAAITPRTKALLLNSPNNPSGAMYSSQELATFAEIIVRHDLYCITDEIYEHITYTQKHCSIASFGPEIQERCVVINGVSKSYAMTGWRIGYTASNPQLAATIGKIQGQTTHHPSNASQYGAIAALEQGRDFYLQMRDSFESRRAYVLSELKQIKGLRVPEPEGAFYAFPDVSAFYGLHTPAGKVIGNSLELCTYLLEKERLAIIPGAAFGMDTCVRLSYAASLDTLRKAMQRFQSGLRSLS